VGSLLGVTRALRALVLHALYGAGKQRTKLAFSEGLPAGGNWSESVPLGTALECKPSFAKLRFDGYSLLALLPAIIGGAIVRTAFAAGASIDDRRPRIPNIPPTSTSVLYAAMRHAHTLPRSSRDVRYIFALVLEDLGREFALRRPK